MVCDYRGPDTRTSQVITPSFGKTVFSKVLSLLLVEAELRGMTLYVVLLAIEDGALKFPDIIVDLFRSPVCSPGFVGHIFKYAVMHTWT